MIEFGRTLREAREAKGLSISQVAETTRIMHSIVDGLENENFSGIPAPIYGRGFVKLYCETVGLDPKPMIAEFMEIYNGNRDVGIKERPRPAAPVATPVAAEPPAAATSVATLAPEPAPEPEPEPPAEQEPEPIFAQEPPPFSRAAEPSEPDLFSMPATEPPMPHEKPSQSISRYATPVRQRPEYHLPPMLGRWAALGVCALVVVVLAVLGLRALYHATSPAPSAVEDATPKAAAAVVAAEKREATAAQHDAKPRKERVPQEIPSLYID